MASAPVTGGDIGLPLRLPGVSRALLAELAFWLAAAAILGTSAWNAANGHWMSQPNRDVYQHLAALQALIDDIRNPANPFVISPEGSRHFHPYWVAVAALARLLDWNAWQAIAVASCLSMATLAVGIRLFARVYFRSALSPLVLLGTMVLGWWFPISHTGYHSVETLAEGASYPAALLIGLSLILWALLIRALDQARVNWWLVPLTALMFATHQLGAGIALIVGACILLLWPNGSRLLRVTVAALIGSGVLLSMLWPYHNPVGTLIAAGNPHWEDGPRFYDPFTLFRLFVPSLIGIAGLLRPVIAGTGRPLMAALAMLLTGFATGALGFQTGVRFGAPAVLILHIGMAGLLLRMWQPGEAGDRAKLGLFAAGVFTVSVQATFVTQLYYPPEAKVEAREGNLLFHARDLTGDIPDDQPVAAFGVAAWPLVGVGQKVVSVPWPEPLIRDLDRRQQMTEWVFADGISPAERRARAGRLGVKTLVIHFRDGHKKWWRPQEFGRLLQGARQVRRSGAMVRIDL